MEQNNTQHEAKAYKMNGINYPALTRAQRNACYRKAFSTFRTHPAGPFLCNVMVSILRDDFKYVIPITFDADQTQVTKAFFPELAQHLPLNYKGWPISRRGDTERERALSLAIENSNHI